MRQSTGYATLFAGLMLGMTLTGGAFASTATSPILGHAPTMLVVTENAAAGNARVTASQSLVVSGAGVQSPGLSRIALLTKQSATLAVVPSMSVSASRFTSNQDAANAVGLYVRSYTGPISRAVVSVMQTLKSQPIGAMFSFIQNVKIAGKQAQAIASEWVRPDGSYDYLGVKVSNTNSSILFAVYTEGEISSGLPSNWNLPNPGALTWGVATTKLDPATGGMTMTMEAINGSVWHNQSFLKNGGPLGPYGLYDEPQVATISKQQVVLNCQIDPATKVCSRYAPGQSVPNNNNASFDPNTGMKALISAQIQPLMNRYNANSAFVTYGRTVKPVYLPPDAAGVRKAVLAVDVTSRKAQLLCSASGGTAVFINSGSIGWMLDYSFDKYLVQPTGSFTKIGDVDKHEISPNKSYQVQGTATIPAGVSATSALANKVVDPWGSGAVYSIYNDTAHGLPVSDYMPNPLPTVIASISSGPGSRNIFGVQACANQKGDLYLDGVKVQWGPLLYWAAPWFHTAFVSNAASIPFYSSSNWSASESVISPHQNDSQSYKYFYFSKWFGWNSGYQVPYSYAYLLSQNPASLSWANPPLVLYPGWNRCDFALTKCTPW